MKKLIKVVFGIVVVASLGAGYVAYGMYSAHEPIADLGQATHVDAEIYDASYARSIEEIRGTLVDMRTRLTAPALSIAVSVNGELVWAEAHGVVDLASLAPVTLASRFPAGSIGKPFTAVAAAQLMEQGLLDLDAEIHTYLPNYPDTDYPITTRQLLSHQAGIRHYGLSMEPPWFQERMRNIQYDTVTDSLSIFQGDPLLFEPDTDFQYTTYGYTLVGAVMEAASGTAYLDLMQQNIFGPLGLSRTGRDITRADRVMGYSSYFSDTELLQEPEVNNSYKWAGGGFVSTPTDLVRFGNAVLYGELVSDETRDMLFTPRELSSGDLNPQHYGLGFRNGGMYYPRGSENIITMINHGGTTIGVISILMIFPESGLVVAMQSNSAGADGSSRITREAAGIARIFLDHMGYVPEGYEASGE